MSDLNPFKGLLTDAWARCRLLNPARICQTLPYTFTPLGLQESNQQDREIPAARRSAAEEAELDTRFFAGRLRKRFGSASSAAAGTRVAGFHTETSHEITTRNRGGTA